MIDHPNIIILNGREFNEEALRHLIKEKLSSPHLPAWESELFSFLEEWISESETIEARTSGSTGDPQMIRLPKNTMEQSAYRTIDFFGLQCGNRILLSLPCRFIAGKMMVVRAIVGRMNLVTIDPSGDFDILLEETFDFGSMVPNQVYKLLENPAGKRKLENIRNLLIGGSAIPGTLEKQVKELKSRVVSTYGMTETASHIAIRELSGERASDIYKCLRGISVSNGKDDCLQIHSAGWGDPLQTKDIAEILSSDAFRILGRIDDVIISGGIKYFPETIERKIESLIQKRFVISSSPDEKLGEKLVLVIEGEPSPSENLMSELKLSMPTFELPKSIIYLPNFPETSSGKIQRAEIKKLTNPLFK